jgi:hypothetical protein
LNEIDYREKTKYSKFSVFVHRNHIKLSFAALTILFFLVLGGFSWLLNDIRDLSEDTAGLTKKTAVLNLANRHRINEIQESRVSSCKRTYSGIRDVLRAFFPVAKKRTHVERTAISKLNRTIFVLRRSCKRQTKPHK